MKKESVIPRGSQYKNTLKAAYNFADEKEKAVKGFVKLTSDMPLKRDTC